jgi:CRP-like cAMP-binding protein
MEAMMLDIQTEDRSHVSSYGGVADADTLLERLGLPRTAIEVRRREILFSQGDPADSVMYLRKGGIRLSVVAPSGKEAIVGILGPGAFLGEESLAGRDVRLETATAMLPSSVIVVPKQQMQRLMHEHPSLQERFLNHMLARNIRLEEDLADQLLNSSEKRLARTLLLLARYGKQDDPQLVLQRVSQETLAEMIGTTRPRVNVFMNKFKKLGFIEYSGQSGCLKINPSLLSVVLHE